MTEDEFEALAIKVLSGAGSPDEEKNLRHLTSQDAERANSLAETKAILAFAKATLPTAIALEKQEPHLPAYRLNELKGAVRRHFPQKRKSSKPWWREWFPQLATGSVAALVLIALLAYGMSPVSGPVEFGSYADSPTRGGDEELSLKDIPGLEKHSFSKEEDFTLWQQKGGNTSASARIWLDDEHDLIHIVHERKWSFFSSEQTVPLPAETAKREALLKSLIQEIHGENQK